MIMLIISAPKKLYGVDMNETLVQVVKAVAVT